MIGGKGLRGRWFGPAAAVGLTTLVASALWAPADAQEEPVLVFAAASLQTVLDELAPAWQAATGHQVLISYAGTSALARQIEEGAPADLFISADLAWMDYVEERGLIDKASRVALLANRIVLIAPVDSEIDLTIGPEMALAEALGDGRLAVANTEAVPAGRYAKAALESLGLWSSVQARLAEAENVRAALSYVALGEAPLGIVYQTDAAAEPAVRVVDTFPEETHPPITYPVALLAGRNNPGAAGFIGFLRSPQARAAFETWGFTVLNE